MLQYNLQKRILIVLFLGISFIMQGCTNLTVKPAASEGAQGFRYYLPQPYLLVTPSSDGETITVEPQLLPDYSRGYVIDGWSFFATHDLTVTKSEQGLLTSVIMKTDSTAVANTLIEQGGALGTEIIKLKAAEKKAKDSAKNTLGIEGVEKKKLKKPARRFRPSLFQVKVTENKLELIDIKSKDPNGKEMDWIQVLSPELSEAALPGFNQ